MVQLFLKNPDSGSEEHRSLFPGLDGQRQAVAADSLKPKLIHFQLLKKRALFCIVNFTPHIFTEPQIGAEGNNILGYTVYHNMEQWDQDGENLQYLSLVKDMYGAGTVRVFLIFFVLYMMGEPFNPTFNHTQV